MTPARGASSGTRARSPFPKVSQSCAERMVPKHDGPATPKSNEAVARVRLRDYSSPTATRSGCTTRTGTGGA
jgi:hypothetical protein